MASHLNGYSYGPFVANQSYGSGDVNSAANAQPVEKYGMTDSGLYYQTNNSDSYVNAMNQEAAWFRDDLIRREGYAREDSAYQRLVQDLQKAGINPVLALAGAESMAGSYGQSASTFKTSSYDSNEKTQAANSAKVIAAILGLLGTIALAAL